MVARESATSSVFLDRLSVGFILSVSIFSCAKYISTGYERVLLILRLYRSGWSIWILDILFLLPCGKSRLIPHILTREKAQAHPTKRTDLARGPSPVLLQPHGNQCEIAGVSWCEKAG
jgi:hypothetical protein